MNRGCVGCTTGLDPSQNLTGDWTASRVYAQRLRMMDGSQSDLFETQTNGIFFSKNINLDTEPLTQTINFMTTTISGTYTAALRGQINSVTVATSNTAADVAVSRNQLIISSPATAIYAEISSLQVVAPLSSVNLFRPGVYRATWVTTNASSIGIAAFYVADTPSLGTHSSSDTLSGFRSSAITSGSIGKTANFEALGTTSGTISNAAYWINNNAATCGSGFVSGTNGDTCLYRGRSGAWTGGAGIDFYTDTGYICGGPTCSLVTSTAQGVYDSGVRVMSSVSCTGASCSLSNGALSITVSGGGVTSLAGTTNQITASASTGAVTLSLPAVLIGPGSVGSVTNVDVGTIITGRGTTPSFVFGLGANCASSATGTLNGTNQMMYLSFTTGTGSCGSNANIAVLTFGAMAGVTTRINCAVNAAQGAVDFWVDSTATTFSIRSSGTTALLASTLYAFAIGPCSGY